jgi:hypothetical protein
MRCTRLIMMVSLLALPASTAFADLAGGGETCRYVEVDAGTGSDGSGSDGSGGTLQRVCTSHGCAAGGDVGSTLAGVGVFGVGYAALAVARRRRRNGR